MEVSKILVPVSAMVWRYRHEEMSTFFFDKRTHNLTYILFFEIPHE